MNNMNQMMGNMNLNMNQMGMNSHLMTNFGMDETVMKFRPIIDSYEQKLNEKEKKISELEKKIREKDFEIMILTKKVNDYKKKQMNMNMNMNNQMNNMGNPMNMANQMNMNNQMNNMGNPMNMNNQININNPINMMNPMNMNWNWMEQYNNSPNNINMNFPMQNMNNQQMNNVMNNNPDDNAGKINIIFDYKKVGYNELCSYDENIKKVIKRFCKKLGLNYNSHKFIFNAKGLAPTLSVAEAGITNMSRIFVIETMGIKGAPGKQSDSDDENDKKEETFIILFKDTKGLRKYISVNPEHSIGTAIKKYLVSIDRAELISSLSEGSNRIAFLFNGIKVKINDKTKVKDFFNNRNPSIVVNDVTNLIGA